MPYRDRFGRDKASQRRRKIRQPAGPPANAVIALSRGDAVRWEGHKGTVERIIDDMADIAEDSIGRVWRLPVTMLVRC